MTKITKENRENVLIKRIEEGCYDDRLDIVMSNSDRLHNYPVWKAANRRKLLVGKGENLKLPSVKKARPKLEEGLTCGPCSEGHRKYVEEVGQVLAEAVRHNRDYRMSIGIVEGSRFSIETMEYAGKPFAYSTIGDVNHRVQFTAGQDVCGGDVYSVCLESAGFDTERHYYDELSDAQAKLFEVMRDEQLRGHR